MKRGFEERRAPVELEGKERADIWSVPALDDLHLLRARFVTYGFKRHAHDYFVIGLVEGGVQKFAYGRQQYVTPATGLIVINPGEPHTGEAAVPTGFHYRALYPEANVLQQVASEMQNGQAGIPFFMQPVIHDPPLFVAVRRLHQLLETARSALEYQSGYHAALAQLIARHADTRPPDMPIRRERTEVARLRRYLDEHYAENIQLADLARLVNWTPYYLLRVFRREVGLPPHAYLETVRVRQAQRLITAGMPLAQVAYETGFSSQSHFTTVFKQFIGVTPGQYRSIS